MLTPWKESYDQARYHIKKQRHYFANKGPSSQAYGFSNGHVWLWELDCEEIWVPKNWWFELWCWRWLLRVPLTARRSNQSILKEISPGCSLEGIMINLKLQYFGHLMRNVELSEKLWCWEGLGAGGDRVDRGWDAWMTSPAQWMWVWVNSGNWWWQGGLVCCNSWGCKESGMTERLNWTEIYPHLYKWANFITFYGWVTFHCVYLPHLLYPFLCWWTFKNLDIGKQK